MRVAAAKVPVEHGRIRGLAWTFPEEVYKCGWVEMGPGEARPVPALVLSLGRELGPTKQKVGFPRRSASGSLGAWGQMALGSPSLCLGAEQSALPTTRTHSGTHTLPPLCIM